ncbi:MAG: hypothetical protein J6Q68_01500 [Clostridia bacterium]|nr:hypothetical protein [Clostridia bacterium]
MNMFDEAAAIRGMIDMCGMTQSQIAEKMGCSQSHVANKLRLLRLPDSVRGEICAGGLCERQARMLLRLDSEEDMLFAARKFSERGLTVSESEAIVDMLVECEAPRIISSRTERRERLDSFESFLDASVKSLIAFGIRAQKRTDRLNEKKYITILVEDS